MISRQSAIQIIQDTVKPTTEIDTVGLFESYGRTLAENIISDIDIPPFNRVTMDGYAVVSSDGPGLYSVIEDIPAGKFPTSVVEPGSVSKVMTGAPLPDGADAVIQVEKTGGFVNVGQSAQINEKIRKGQNISSTGEDVNKGDLVIKPGAYIRSAEISVLASMGYDPVKCYRNPSVAILATGDELVAPSQKPGPGQIRNSNGYSMFAQTYSLMLDPISLGVGQDNENDLRDKIERGATHDFLLVSGGVSAGDRDFVPGILRDVGYDLLFHKVNIKPGKPITFGVSNNGRYVFGVPGNPVSSMVAFELFIKPAIRWFSRAPVADSLELEATLLNEFKRKNASREEFRPALIKWENGRFTAELIQYHGSGHFAAMTKANGIVRVDPEVDYLAKDQKVTGKLFSEFYLPIDKA